MNLLFEGWRRYLLNEITYAQAQKRLEGNAIKKIIKSSAYELMKHLQSPSPGHTWGRSVAEGNRRRAEVHKMILESEKYVEVFAKIYGGILKRFVDSLDLEDKQQGAALSWLISIGKTDKTKPTRPVFMTPLGLSIYSDILSEIVDIPGAGDNFRSVVGGKLQGKIQDLASLIDEFNELPAKADIKTKEQAWIYSSLRRVLEIRMGEVGADIVMASDFINEYQDYLRGPIEKFFHYQQFMPEKDINKIKTIENFMLNTRDADDAIKKYQEKKSYADAEEGTEVFRDDDEFFISAIHNKGAACHWGKGTDWCTAAPGLDYFEHYYSPESPLIFIKKKHQGHLTGEGLYQFHYKTQQFMDITDTPVREPDVGNLHLEIMKTDIPNKYPAIKSVFIKGAAQADWHGKIKFAELGWNELDKMIMLGIPNFLFYSGLLLSRQGARDRWTVTDNELIEGTAQAYEIFVSNKLKEGNTKVLRYLIQVCPSDENPWSGSSACSESKRIIKDNIVHIIRAMPEDDNYFMPFRISSVVEFFENREFYDSLPNDLKSKFIRFRRKLRIEDGLWRTMDGIRTGGLDGEQEEPEEEPREEPEEGPEEEFSEIKERWKRIGGIIL